MSRPLILASTSPYRRELLERLGLPFTVANPQTDETPLPDESPEALSLRLAEAKARAVAKLHPDALIIGSDQVATVDGKIYGKPGNRERGIAQLQELSGKTVNFFTGLCLLDSCSNQAQVRGVPTLVTFRTLSPQEIENYLDREPAFNCAGSAKSEGLGIALLQSMRGDDPNALVGLPLIALCDMLRNAGIKVL
ncbi:Maf family nucleotide pyrophosphatase [Dechloromonas sp. ZY10]|uniref:Maf family protein n=1 Tax=Dechloromonas aquae TaxID=2664436 RepID=UPI0035280683